MIITSTIFFISPALRSHFVAIHERNILNYNTIISGLQVESMDFDIYPALFSPKAMNMGLSGRSSDLSRSREAFPSLFFLYQIKKRDSGRVSQNHHR
jgi:hypothetical protein